MMDDPNNSTGSVPSQMPGGQSTPPVGSDQGGQAPADGGAGIPPAAEPEMPATQPETPVGDTGQAA